MSSTQLTVLRTAGSAVIAALAGLSYFYPHNALIADAIAVAGILGIHVIPSIGQLTPTIVKEINAMAENLSGTDLMGITKPSTNPDAPVETPAEVPAETAVTAPDTAGTAPDTAVAAPETPEPPVTPEPAPAQPSPVQALRDAAATLVKVAESLESM